MTLHGYTSSQSSLAPEWPVARPPLLWTPKKHFRHRGNLVPMGLTRTPPHSNGKLVGLARPHQADPEGVDVGLGPVANTPFVWKY